MVRRQVITVIATCFIFLIAGIAFIIFSKPYYTAGTQLLVEPTIQSAFEDKSARLNGPVDLVELDSQVEIIKSFGLAGQVADKLNLANDPAFAKNSNHVNRLVSRARAALKLESAVESNAPRGSRLFAIKKLRKNLSAVRMGNSKIVEIKYTAADSAVAATLANTFAQEYLAARQRVERDTGQRRLSWLKQRVAELKQLMIASSLAVQNYRTEINEVGNTASNKSVIMHDLERKAETYRGLYANFLIRLQEASQRQSFVTRHGRVVSSALRPVYPSFPNIKLVLIISLVLGLMAGIGLGAFREW
ncbi:MAG: GNVR domain-containing protein [Hyphomicrobiaceae bacterium]